MKIGNAIKLIRKTKMHETQMVFAKKVGMTQTYLSQIEAGEKEPTFRMLDKIVKHTKTPAAVILWIGMTPEEKIEWSSSLSAPGKSNLINLDSPGHKRHGFLFFEEGAFYTELKLLYL